MMNCACMIFLLCLQLWGHRTRDQHGADYDSISHVSGQLLPVDASHGTVHAHVVVLFINLIIPLQVASSTFYEVHEQFLKKRKGKHIVEQQAVEAQIFATKAAKDTAWKRRLQLMRTAISMSIESLDAFLKDLQAPSERSCAQGGPALLQPKSAKSSLLQRATVVVNECKTTMSSIGRDLEALALTSMSIYNKQPKEHSKQHHEESTLLVC
jgi:hypothetical protein